MTGQRSQQTADDDGQHIDNDSDWHRLSLFPYVNFTENSCLSIVQEIESFIKPKSKPHFARACSILHKQSAY